ncbi:MAG TPA: protein-glutamine glutaminase family protein [Pyrinomonadaceae bacterium]|nr:protein-glutamine glutaminase family protein [Pyrinomonadaceae bacterium]
MVPFGPIIISIIKAVNAIRKLFSNNPPGPVTQCPLGALSKAKADEMFKTLASQNHIPFDYPDDCCYSRAHEMCRIMKAEGVDCRKVWNYGQGFPDNSTLQASTPNHPNGKVSWRYHVAPVVSVNENGTCTDMVMDPSLFDRPVTVAEWKQKQQDQNSTIEITSATPYFRTPKDAYMEDDPTYAKTSATLKQHGYDRDLRNKKAGK